MYQRTPDLVIDIAKYHHLGWEQGIRPSSQRFKITDTFIYVHCVVFFFI